MDAIASRLKTIFSLAQAAPNFEPTKLELFGRGVDDSLQGLEIAISQLEELTDNPEVEPEVLEKLIYLSNLVLEDLDAHDEAIAKSKFEFGHAQSPELFEIAQKYCALHAAASCLHMWIYNRKLLGDFFSRGEWLVLSIHRLLRTIRPMPYFISETYGENVANELVKLHNANKLFSMVPIQLAQSNITIQEDKINELIRI